MNETEKRVRDAFDSVHMPACVRQRAMAAVEERRAKEDSASPSRMRVIEGAAASNAKAKRSRKKTGVRLFGARIALAACLVLAAVGVGGFALASTPSAYVGIDVNPSVELGINRFDRVVEAKAYNQDGQEVLDQAQVVGMPYVDALDAVESAMADQGYFADDAVIEVNVVCESDDLYAEIESASLLCFGRSGGEAHCMRASSDEHRSAASAGMGMGKYRVYQDLSAAGVDISADEASGMTMRELYDLASAEGVDVETGCGNASGVGCEGQGGGSGAGSGNGGQGGGANGLGSGSSSGSGGSGSGSGGANGSGQGAGQGGGSGWQWGKTE